MQLAMLYKIPNDIVDIRAEDYLRLEQPLEQDQTTVKSFVKLSPELTIANAAFFQEHLYYGTLYPASAAEAPCLASFKH